MKKLLCLTTCLMLMSLGAFGSDGGGEGQTDKTTGAEKCADGRGNAKLNLDSNDPEVPAATGATNENGEE